ncbi:GntR family transcriptional regulator [Methylopila henanensis]|uniref:GntR family transcriptional regulator n=1 Tax=Methylopila henanensis TaxID=873516 RepID=A0ABW4KBP1_9HYPH
MPSRPSEETRRTPSSSRETKLSRREPFAHQIATTLRDRIIRGDLPAGGRIVERSLCETLAVSRTPLREALKLLELEGLIELSQNRGARIMSFTAEEASDLFEVIAGLESLAAEIAALRMKTADLEELDEMHSRMMEHYHSREKDPYFELNSAIHDRIVRLSRNPVLVATHANLMLRARRGRYMAIVDPQRWEESVSEHEALMAALHARDADAARRVWKRHLLRTGETVCAVLAAGVLDPAQLDAVMERTAAV